VGGEGLAEDEKGGDILVGVRENCLLHFEQVVVLALLLEVLGLVVLHLNI
jgi:hypothetical protein